MFSKIDKRHQPIVSRSPVGSSKDHKGDQCTSKHLTVKLIKTKYNKKNLKNRQKNKDLTFRTIKDSNNNSDEDITFRKTKKE